MASGAHQRKNGVAESKAWVSTYSIGQVIGGFFNHRRIAGGAEPITSHKFCVGQRVSCVSGAWLNWGRTQRALQRTRDLLHEIILQIWQLIQIKVSFSCETSSLRTRVKHLHRKTRLAFRHLNSAVDHKTDAQSGRDLRSR